MTKKRVVVTGIGTVNPCGNTISDYWESLTTGKSGISTITRFETTGFPTRFAGSVQAFKPEEYLEKKEIKRASMFILLGHAAAMQAVSDSGLNIANHAEDVGVEIGSGIGGIDIIEKMAYVLRDKGPSKVSPFTVPMMIIDMISGFVSIKTGAKGPNASAVSACASSNHAMGNAFKMIQNGTAKAMITGGAESALTPLGLTSFSAARSLSTDNENYHTASKPFDLNRSGFVMGEGAGILIFEERDFALSRGASIYGEVVGFGSAGDAFHITAPAENGEGAARAMRIALADATMQPEEIDYINAHGTSTVLNDKNETAAIKHVFKDHAYKLSISSTKSMTGHLLGAASAIEFIASLLCMKNNIVVPTINYTTPDPECDLDITPNKAVKKDINAIMSNSLGFGGHNAIIIAKKHP